MARGNDALNPLSSLYDNHRTATTSDDRLTTYGYDLCERAVLMKTSSGSAAANATVNEYDALGRLKKRRLHDGHNLSTGVLAQFEWTHDALGNVLKQEETWRNANGTVNRTRSTAMTYDAVNRLKTEVITDSGTATVTTTYHYDGAGNRTGKEVVLGSGPAPAGVVLGYWTYTYNNANQLTHSEKRVTPTGNPVAAESFTYDYDVNGNRISKKKTAGLTTVATYAWDAWGRLKETAIPVSATATRYYRNTYDYRMRRLAKSQNGSGLTTRHTAITYSGGLSVAEYNRTGNTALAAGASAAKQYVRGPDLGGGVGGLLYSYTLNDTTQTLKFNLSNGRGDIVAQTGSAGAIVWTASYEAYGKQTKETGTNTDTQRANSKEEDEATGLLNEGHRYRDLDTGVWLSRDPAGFVDGPNLYAYVKQNPWTAWDPDGLKGEYAVATMQALNDGMEAVAYVGAWLADGVVNAIAAFGGGPGKGSFEPSPVRRSLGISTGLTMDREGYLAMQDATEALAFTLGGASSSQPPVATGKGTVDKSQALAETQASRSATSPNSQMRKNANARSTYLDPLSGKTVPATGTLPADHIISQKAINDQPGFGTLTMEQQSWVLNHPLNTQGLPQTFNSSKGAKKPGEWLKYKGKPLDPSYIQNDVERGRFLEPFIQEKTKNFVEQRSQNSNGG